MPLSQVYEIVGYIASLLIAISLMMSSILRLRVINLIGAIFFTAYGLLIHAYPVAVVNGLIILIDLYYLFQMLRTREFFRLLAVHPDSEYLQYFLSFYAADIQRFQPGFNFTPAANQLVFFILRNVVPAGLVVGELKGEGSLAIRLDYAIPGYRDLKIGRFVFQQHAQDFREQGIQRIYADPRVPAHARYLEQMGFHPETLPSGETHFCLTL